jgi:hypothetical protein
VLLDHERVAVLGAGADFQLWQFGLWQARALARRGGFGGQGGLILDFTGDGFGLPRWFRGSVEAAFPPVLFELGHEGILS